MLPVRFTTSGACILSARVLQPLRSSVVLLASCAAV